MHSIVLLAALALADPSSSSTQVMPAGQAIQLPAAETAAQPAPPAGEWAGPMVSEAEPTSKKKPRAGMPAPERPLRTGERAPHHHSGATPAERDAVRAAASGVAAAVAGRR